MVVGCGPTCLKYTFFTFNFLVFLCGGAILGLSLWVRFDNSVQKSLDTTLSEHSTTPVEVRNFQIALYVIMGIGGMLILCGGLGCLGACCENPCLLGTFFAIMLILFLAEIAAAIYIFVRKDTIKKEVSEWYKGNFVAKYETNNDIKEMLNSVQEAFGCCGANGCLDYPSVGIVKPPDSCKCMDSITAPMSTPGCVDKLSDKLKLLAIITICLVAIELLAMIFSCILCSSIRRYPY